MVIIKSAPKRVGTVTEGEMIKTGEGCFTRVTGRTESMGVTTLEVIHGGGPQLGSHQFVEVMTL